MRPRLASLALLLLALCSTSFATTREEYRQRQEYEPLQQQILKEKGGYALSVILASAYEMGIQKGEFKELDKFKPLENGIQCAYADAILAKKFNEVLYGIGKDIDEQKERDWYMKHLSGGKKLSDCTAPTTPAEKCFCNDKHTLIYCLGKNVENNIQSTKGLCSNEALEDLKNSGGKAMAQTYDYSQFAAFGSSSNFQNSLKDGFNDLALVKQITGAAKDLLCEATDPKIENKVKTLLATEYSYAQFELMSLIQNMPKSQFGAISKACKNKKYKTEHPFGSCFCAFDKGFSFCLFKVWGKEFEKQKYLKCAGGVGSFDESVTPKAALLAPTEDSDSGSKPSSVSASSSLVLLPLATAAAMLLRH